MPAMADHFTYLPSIGIVLMISWGIPYIFKNDDTRRKILFPVALGVLAILAVLTWQQCGHWKNTDHAF
jgi:hypothetical protein